MKFLSEQNLCTAAMVFVTYSSLELSQGLQAALVGVCLEGLHSAVCMSCEPQ